MRGQLKMSVSDTTITELISKLTMLKERLDTVIPAAAAENPLRTYSQINEEEGNEIYENDNS